MPQIAFFTKKTPVHKFLIIGSRLILVSLILFILNACASSRPLKPLETKPLETKPVEMKPLEIYPVSVPVPKDKGLVGDFAKNDLLANLGKVGISPYARPEHVEMYNGYLYASCHGKIIRVREDGSDLTLVSDTGGETLGFAFDKEGYLVYTELKYKGTMSGIFKLDVSKIPATPILVADKIAGEPIYYPDALVIASDGTIYLSDATNYSVVKYGSAWEGYSMEAWYFTSGGRILAYNPKTGKGRIVAKGLSFANGVALSYDEKYLYVTETNEYNIWKIDVTKENAKKGDPGYENFFSNLPGYPDNLTRGQGGRYWVGLTAPRNEESDRRTADGNWRAWATVFPSLNKPYPMYTNTHAFAFNDSGKVVSNLMAIKSEYPQVTGVCETDDRLYLHTNNKLGYIGYVEKKAVGLKK